MSALWRCSILIITGAAAALGLSAQVAPPRGNQPDTPTIQRQQLRSSRTFLVHGGLASGAPVTLAADRIQAVLTPGHTSYHAIGDVQIRLGDLELSADDMTYDAASGEATASGHVAFDSLSEQTHIEGVHATYNFVNSTGEFDDFHGVSGLRLRGRTPTALASNPLIFTGRRLQRLGPDTYRLEDGTVTSCSLPHPKWVFSAQQVQIVLGKNATLHHAVFRLLDVPIFYSPFVTYSTTRTGRHSGVLVPDVSKSNVKGYVLGDSYYWAAARNVNLTLGGEYYSARGWADHLSLASRPTRNSDLTVQLDGVFDRGLALPGGGRLRQGGQELHVTGDHTASNGFRTVLDVDYLSSYLYRLVFKNTLSEAVNSEAVSTAFSEKQWDGQDVTVNIHRYQDFLGTTPTASLSLAELPGVDWSAYAQRLTHALPLYFSWGANAGLLDRSEPGFATGAMSRLDFSPQLHVPVSTALGTFTGGVGVDATYYSERQLLLPAASPVASSQLLSSALWRNALSASLEWRPPALAKAFSGPGGFLGDRLEHVFEPQIGYHLTTGVDDADEVIRFDELDIVSNTSEFEYGFTNRLLAANGPKGHSRELISWTLLQKYYFDPTFGGALQPGERNVFLANALLSPFAAEALPLRFSPLSSVIRVSPFSRFDGEWRLDYNSHNHQITASAFTGDFHFGKGVISGSDYVLHPPPGSIQAASSQSFNQVRLGLGYGNALSRGSSFAGNAAYDVHTGRLLYTTVQMGHNWDCCGFTLAYRRFALASVRRENQFLISFSLANIATFGNLRRAGQIF
ncbi:MAG: LPS-assembly protein LptD [Terriglobales bacterium]